MEAKARVDETLSDIMAEHYEDPLGYVMFNFPWDTDTSIQLVELAPKYRKRFPNCKWGPDKWACEYLDELGAEIKKRGFRGAAVPPIRMTTASGHGIGKSTLVAWLIMFIMDTKPYSRGMVTATTAEQLRTKTWAELGKWLKLSLTQHLYNYTTGRGSMSLTRKAHPERWRCDAVTCREENSEAFQGLHAGGGVPFYIFDEASGIPNAIFEARAGGATDGMPMWFDFGNPTRKSGYFFENTVGKYRHRFIARQIDSRSVAITNKALLDEYIEDYGIDHDFVKVKVRGVFPAAGSMQFISSDQYLEAANREPWRDDNAPLIIGVDVARFGDDETVIYPRIGWDAKSWGYQAYRGLDNVQVAQKVIDMIQEFGRFGRACDALFVDGGGLGSGVVDVLRHLGYNPIEVNFGGVPSDRIYRYKVDEMWGNMRAGLDKLCLPEDDKLRDQLTQREYTFMEGQDKLTLESKKDMKKRLGAESSPDVADALALTFAAPVVPLNTAGLAPKQGYQSVHDFDPFNYEA